MTRNLSLLIPSFAHDWTTLRAREEKKVKTPEPIVTRINYNLILCFGARRNRIKDGWKKVLVQWHDKRTKKHSDKDVESLPLKTFAPAINSLSMRPE
jgi:hypothetical protein